MTLIFRLIIRRDIWIFQSKVFSSGNFKKNIVGFILYVLSDLGTLERDTFIPNA